MSSLLILAAGFFEDSAFAAGEAVAAMVLGLFVNIVNRFVGFIRRFRIMHAQLGLRLQSAQQVAAGNQPFKFPTPLIIEKAEQGAAKVCGVGYIGTIHLMLPARGAP